MHRTPIPIVQAEEGQGVCPPFHVSNCFQGVTPVESTIKSMATEYNVHKQSNMNQRSTVMRKSREEMQGNKLLLKLFNNWLAHGLTEKSQTDTRVGGSLEGHAEWMTHRTPCQDMGQETPASTVYTHLTYPGVLRWHLWEITTFRIVAASADFKVSLENVQCLGTSLELFVLSSSCTCQSHFALCLADTSGELPGKQNTKTKIVIMGWNA